MLEKGNDEPVYLPADENFRHNRVIFAHGYFSSALHEISHWCLAGEARRKMVDFGYWYVPDGRSDTQQLEFEKVEVKPQALEWLFSLASGREFNISFDNLSGDKPNLLREAVFKDRVYEQAMTFMKDSLPERAESFINALLKYYDREQYWKTEFLKRTDI